MLSTCHTITCEEMQLLAIWGSKEYDKTLTRMETLIECAEDSPSTQESLMNLYENLLDSNDEIYYKLYQNAVAWYTTYSFLGAAVTCMSQDMYYSDADPEVRLCDYAEFRGRPSDMERLGKHYNLSVEIRDYDEWVRRGKAITEVKAVGKPASEE